MKYILFLDAANFLESAITWLKNENGKPKRIFPYALLIRHPSGKVHPIALMEHVTSMSTTYFQSTQAFLRFRECEQNISGYVKLGIPCVVRVDFSWVMIQAVLQRLGGETLDKYLERTCLIIFKTSQPNDFSATFIIGRLNYCTSVTEAVTVKNFSYISSNRDITKNVTKSLNVMNQTINNFDEPLIDLIESSESNIIDGIFDDY